MPYVDIISSSGPLQIYYNVARPDNPNADKIDANLPTVIFIHALYVGQQVFEAQFRDRRLRRFNLIGFDSRGHGESKGPVPGTWSPKAAAEDLYCFMKALDLPPCHIVSMSMHTLTAITFATKYPEMVLSEFIISPVPEYEDEDVIAGRTEVWECWKQAFADLDHVDTTALMDAVWGSCQLAYNNSEKPLVVAMYHSALRQAIVQWGYDKLQEYYNSLTSFTLNNTPLSPSALGQMHSLPFKIVRGEADLLYSAEVASALVDRLREAGVQSIEMEEIKGSEAAHYACVTAKHGINEMLHNWLLQNIQGEAPPIPAEALSPYTDILENYEKNESDSDD